MGYRCAVFKCKTRNARYTYRVPNPRSQKELFKAWVNATGNEKFLTMFPDQIYKCALFCTAHFLPSENEDLKRKLKRCVPSLNLPPQPISYDERVLYNTEIDLPEHCMVKSNTTLPNIIESSRDISDSTELPLATKILGNSLKQLAEDVYGSKSCCSRTVDTTESTTIITNSLQQFTADVYGPDPNDSTEEITEIEVDETIADYALVDLHYDLDALNADEKPKNWTYNWIDTGLLLAYFGDSFRHFSRSLLICRDMTMEVRVEGKICKSIALSTITSIQDLRNILYMLSKMSICIGVESKDDTSCPSVLVKSLEENSRCTTCSSRQKEIENDAQTCDDLYFGFN